MDLDLIIPEKRGGQYYFDLRCQKNLEEIIYLKSIGFSLSEIKIIFFYKSFGKLAAYEEDIYYRTLFIDKYRKLEKDIEKLSQIKNKLKHEVDNMSEESSKPKLQRGIDLRNLSLFKCIKCSGSLILQDGIIRNNQVMSGSLECSCGEKYIIEAGILMVEACTETSTTTFNDNYIMEYINLTDAVYLDSLHKSLEWSSRKVSVSDLKGKTLLELGTGIGFFLRNIYNDLPEDCVYIAIDHNLERHKFLKSLLERVDKAKNVLFICTDFLKIPIKEKSVDFVLDISGTSNYSFKHEEFLLSLTDRYIKEDAFLLGSFITFKNFSSNSLIERNYRKNFIVKNIKEEIDNLKYNALEEFTSNYVDKGGRYESYFVEGEKVYSYSFFGKR